VHVLYTRLYTWVNFETKLPLETSCNVFSQYFHGTDDEPKQRGGVPDTCDASTLGTRSPVRYSLSAIGQRTLARSGGRQLIGHMLDSLSTMSQWVNIHFSLSQNSCCVCGL
jgi:hypothetical protein